MSILFAIMFAVGRIRNNETTKPVVWKAFPCHDLIMRYMILLLNKCTSRNTGHGPLARCVQFRLAHAPGMPGTFSPPPRVSDPDMRHGTWHASRHVTQVPRCKPGSLTSGFLWSRWRVKRSRHSRRMQNSQFYVSDKWPMKCFRSQFIQPDSHVSVLTSMIYWYIFVCRNLAMKPVISGHYIRYV